MACNWEEGLANVAGMKVGMCSLCMCLYPDDQGSVVWGVIGGAMIHIAMCELHIDLYCNH